MKLFVTGTDTGVGKTTVTVAIARHARSLGLRVFAFKPIETGVVDVAADQEALAVAAGDWQREHERGLYRFEQPAAPYVAAGTQAIDVDRIIRMSQRDDVDVVLVEGAGGWRVPITESVDMAELARRLGFPVLVVARASLGTINHSLLSLEAVERDGCKVAALVLSERPEDDRAFTSSNRLEIARRWRGPTFVYRLDTAVTWFEVVRSAQCFT